ncbi:unnamed protein product [Sordaria macrospora k-hell]|uniref:WGS project CABT00000000 data, contig 2.1 n=1 Tax=Sordaria macrospora (strain ATCC MYA-333 / DSM 997 / K(L3346) / K-hell) TaxID=771870 RepID=F7VLJ5_SORMK|nr:uncharacterized protein SMAC_00587 [Sordaria macrospora k-hell]CCC06373.1 unnamed protein product [Sordaria macrospora k-hell]
MTSSSPPDDKIDDEMILDCITVKPKPSHSYTDMTSSLPTQTWLLAAQSAPREGSGRDRFPPIFLTATLPPRQPSTNPLLAAQEEEVGGTDGRISEPEASNKSVEAETPPSKPTNEKTDRPRPSKEGIANKRIQRSENRRGKSRRTSDKTWADLSTVDNKKGLLDTFENQRLATPGRRKQLSECNWVRYRLSALNVLMLGDWAIGPVPRLVLTDPEGRHYELEDARFPTQRGLPDI